MPAIVKRRRPSAGSGTTIPKHYLTRHPELADAAIRRMLQWFERPERDSV